MTEIAARLSAALSDRYAIEKELGAGGMATVYLAHDVRHDRKVAVKVLRPELSAVLGAERFLNEIRVTANLQHPHILQLYDSGAAEGLLYYVMPYVEGESLRERLVRERQLPVDEAVEITRAVAGALDYAHRHGVIHRDIKPENILLHEGQPLVADFGIALAVRAAGGSRLTETGLSLGTPHYMSPEQATGDRALDGRSDIYSLGCVAYEMLAGAPPHTGPTAQAIIAKIVTEAAPSLALARPSVPPHVDSAIHKAIQKLHADRFHTAAEFAEALATPLPAATAAQVRARIPGLSDRPTWRVDWRIAVGAVILALALGWAAARRRPNQPAALLKFTIAVPRVIFMPGPQTALSRDGSLLALSGYGGERGYRIYLRAMGDSLVRPVPGTDNGLAPFFSPDGRWLGFWSDFRLWKVAVEGGQPSVIADSAERFVVWASDGSIVYTALRPGTLRLVRPDGAARNLVRVDSGQFLGLSALPDGHSVLTTLRRSGRFSVMAVSLRDGSMRAIDLPGAVAAKFAAPRYLIYQEGPGGALYAAPFDARGLRLTGPARVITEPVQSNYGMYSQWDVSANGTLAYLSSDLNQLALADRAGRTTLLTPEARAYHHPRFSPDGRRIALDITQAGERDIWVLNTGDRTLSRLTVGEVANDPLWAPDGRRVAYTAQHGPVRGIFIRNADGSGAADSVYEDRTDRSSGSWLPDGSALVSSTAGLRGLWIVPVKPRGPARQVADSRPSEVDAAVSPDGHWLAYVSDESGRQEVYVRPLPGPGGRYQVSAGGGVEPVWTRGGREIVYREYGRMGARLVAAEVRTVPNIEVVTRTPLFDASDWLEAPDHANYDVRPDGNQFVFVRGLQTGLVHLIHGWPLMLGGGSSGGQ